MYNVSVSVVGQMSNMLQYNYRLILSPPNFLSVAPLTSPTEVRLVLAVVGYGSLHPIVCRVECT